MASSMTAAGAVDHLIGQMRKQQDPQMPPDCVGRYLCTKSSWRGKYRRIICVTPNAVITQHPDNLAITNTYLFVGESDIDSISTAPVDQNAEEQEFTLSARSDKKVKIFFAPLALCLFYLYISRIGANEYCAHQRSFSCAVTLCTRP